MLKRSDHNHGLIWQCFSGLKICWAAFWMTCKDWIMDITAPARRELQYSNCEITTDWTGIWETFKEKINKFAGQVTNTRVEKQWKQLLQQANLDNFVMRKIRYPLFVIYAYIKNSNLQDNILRDYPLGLHSFHSPHKAF